MLAREAREKAVIVSVNIDGASDWDTSERLDELEDLLSTAGAETVARVVQNRQALDSAFFVGRGKVEEIEEIRKQHSADIVVFDREISPAQRRNLERHIRARVIDRTQVILDIFAQRARTREGKLQVLLAQLTYSLTQLIGAGNELSRLGGGIGTRGPGETKLETDRRRIRQQIRDLKHDLESVRKHRALGRAERQATPVAVAALVGYTNAGKSTLLNSLTGSTVLSEDKLFATLDPTTRRARLPSGQELLFTDTVGFIRDLPPQLVAAFSATLEEVVEADVIIHVADASHPASEKHIRVVEQVLSELGAGTKPTVLALNKKDLGMTIDATPAGQPAVAISALRSEGLEDLLDCIDQVLAQGRETAEFVVPYHMQHIVSLLHQHGKVLTTEYDEGSTRVVAEVNSVWAKRVSRWLEEDRREP